MTDATDTAAEAPPAPATDASSPQQPRQASRRSRGRGGRGKGRPDDQAAQAPVADAKADAKGKAPRKPHPVLEKLFELYPGLFGARFLPLKRGVYEDLIARHPEAFKPEELKLAMGLHARSTRYLECVAAGHPRHDLDGQVVEPVAPEHVHHAILELFRRRQGRTSDDLGPQLRKRIAAAIEASGLPREDYAALVRSARDEAANAALDDAVAELATQAAKREALLRAFEASGKSETEFAEMYGMSHSEVARSLRRARQDKAPKADADAPAAASS